MSGGGPAQTAIVHRAAPPVPPCADEAELALLIAAFDEARLPAAAWTHAAHLTVGAWYVHRLGPHHALPVLRRAIRRLNEAHGTANTDTSGYHETVTWLYIATIAQLLADQPAQLPMIDRIRAIIAGPVDQLAQRHYSRELLGSPAARLGFLAPDVRPLPLLPERHALEARAT